MESEQPQYMRIAWDIATRIASGEIEEQQKISGRSLLSSEYNVSPETIRKAIKLLSDMKVVDVQEKRGVVILSADNAKRYLQNASVQNVHKELRTELQDMMKQHMDLSRRMYSLTEQMLKDSVNPFSSGSSIPNYEVKISPSSDKIGRDLVSLKFWQETGATIIAIKRSMNLILSPGPFAQLYDGDVVVFVGAPECIAAVQLFLNGTNE